MGDTPEVVIVSTLPDVTDLPGVFLDFSANHCEDRQRLRAVLEGMLASASKPLMVRNQTPEALPQIAHALAPLGARIAWVSVILGDFSASASEDVALLAEFSTHVLTCGAVSEEARIFLRALNPEASHVQVAELSPGCWELVCGAGGLVDVARVGRRAGWLRALEPLDPASDPEPWFVFRAWRPLHPERWLAFATGPHAVGRARGFVWFATHMDRAAALRLCGPCGALAPAGRWWANLPVEQWPDDPALHLRVLARWQEPFGDRRQEVAILPKPGACKAQLTAALSACLLSDEEFAHGQLAWRYLPNPLPDLRWSNKSI